MVIQQDGPVLDRFSSRFGLPGIRVGVGIGVGGAPVIPVFPHNALHLFVHWLNQCRVDVVALVVSRVVALSVYSFFQGGVRVQLLCTDTIVMS